MLIFTILLFRMLNLHFCFRLRLFFGNLVYFSCLSLDLSWSIEWIVRCLVKQTYKFFLLVLLHILWFKCNRFAALLEELQNIRVLADCLFETIIMQILIKCIVAITIGIWLCNKHWDIINIELDVSILACSAFNKFSLTDFSKYKNWHLFLSFFQLI